LRECCAVYILNTRIQTTHSHPARIRQTAAAAYVSIIVVLGAARAIIKGAKSHYFPSALCVFARSLVVIVMCPGIESERERERGHREAAVLQFANSQYPSRPGQ
jgi:hypothetical protein